MKFIIIQFSSSSSSFSLSQIVSSGRVTLPLTGLPCNNGELTVVAEELAVCRDEVLLQFIGRNLDRKDWFGTYVEGATDYVLCTKSIVTHTHTH
jgi:hypothetical protein